MAVLVDSLAVEFFGPIVQAQGRVGKVFDDL